MSPRTRLAPPLLALAALVLAGCGGSPATPDAGAADTTAAASTSAGGDPSPSGSDPTTDDGPADGDVCSQLPVADINEVTSQAGSPIITAATPQDGGCLLAAADAQYLVTVTPQSVDEVVAGRATSDVTAGARAVTVDGDRTWIQDCGAQTCVVEVVGGPDPVDLVDLVVLANPVTSALTR